MCTTLSFLLLYSFFFNDTATTEIYTLSLHDALPIFFESMLKRNATVFAPLWEANLRTEPSSDRTQVSYQESQTPQRRCRSEEHTSELQSRQYLVCRLLLEKKKKNTQSSQIYNLP